MSLIPDKEEVIPLLAKSFTQKNPLDVMARTSEGNLLLMTYILFMYSDMGCITQKVPNVLSRCPPFFWYDTDFSKEKNPIIFKEKILFKKI